VAACALDNPWSARRWPASHFIATQGSLSNETIKRYNGCTQGIGCLKKERRIYLCKPSNPINPIFCDEGKEVIISRGGFVLLDNCEGCHMACGALPVPPPSTDSACARLTNEILFFAEKAVRAGEQVTLMTRRFEIS